MRQGKQITAFLARLLRIVLESAIALIASPQIQGHQLLDQRYESALPVIPLENQPFYQELMRC